MSRSNSRGVEDQHRKPNDRDQRKPQNIASARAHRLPLKEPAGYPLRQHADEHDRGGEQRDFAEHRRRHIGGDLVDRAEQRRRRRGAGDDRCAPADHGDEGFGDIGGADRRKHARHRRENGAGKAGERRADAEGDRIDAVRIDAERRRHVRVLHRSARDQAEPGEAQHRENAAKHDNRDGDDEKRVSARPVLSDLETAERRRKADGGVAEDGGRQPDEKQAQAPGREHRVDHAAVEPADDRALDDDADGADDDRRNDQHRDPDAEAQTIGLDGGITAKHQKLAMREVDDLHHAEDDRQPHADQREAGDGVENLDRQKRYEIHERVPHALPEKRAQNLITYCWLSFGFFLRSQTAAVSDGFCCGKSSSRSNFLSFTSAM